MSFSDIPDDDVPSDLEWRERALAVIPGGASTGSKQPTALYGEHEHAGASHYASASGCTLTTPTGETLIDCTMALGAVAIGYGDEAITQRVLDAVANGNVSGLSHISEVSLAERLCDVIPCAEQVRFLKSGADAVSAAVRIARTYTNRTTVVASGYFGWHDWSSEGVAGVPPGAKSDVTRVAFDDVGALTRAADAAGSSLAAIVIEPVVERLPSQEWIAAARALATKHGAVLVFDEMKTGFRLRPGGYQELSGVEPDLATFGKALADGYPLAAVVGRADVMEAATRTWISSTLASESIALAAAAGVLDWHERAEVCESLETTGEEMRSSVMRAIDASGLPGVSVIGIPTMWLLRFDTSVRESRFIELALTHGVLFKRGAYNFASLAHDEEALLDIERAASSAFVEMREESE